MPRRLLLILLLLMPSGVWAEGPAHPGAAHFVGELFGRVVAEATGPMPQPRRAEQVGRLLTEFADLDHLGGFALGRLGGEARGGRRREYQALFAGTLTALVALGLERYDGERLALGRSSQQGEDVLVESELVRPGGQRVRLAWRLRNDGGRYRVRDVGIENLQLSFLLRDMLTAAVGERADLDKIMTALRRLAAEPSLPALGGPQ